MDGLDVGRGPEGELELNGGHDESNVDTKIGILKKGFVVEAKRSRVSYIARTT